MGDALAHRSASRTAVVALFAVCGGALGGVLIALIVVLIQPSALLESGALQSLLLLVITIAGWSALLGFMPALLTGLIYAFLPTALQRIVVAPVVGGVISAGYAIFFLQVTQQNVYCLPGVVWYAGAGAGAALVCAAVARKFRIDAIGSRTPT